MRAFHRERPAVQAETPGGGTSHRRCQGTGLLAHPRGTAPARTWNASSGTSTCWPRCCKESSAAACCPARRKCWRWSATPPGHDHRHRAHLIRHAADRREPPRPVQPGRTVRHRTERPLPSRPDEVEFKQPQARALFSAIAHDSNLPAASRPATPPDRAGVADDHSSRVRVRVLNGSGAAGVAVQVAAALTSRGFAVAGTGEAATFSHAHSVIEQIGCMLRPPGQNTSHPRPYSRNYFCGRPLSLATGS